MTFQKSWRVYQARLLDCLDSYLGDKRLHIVAAPGSGKTILGLEVIRRLNQPTLVLAPTVTIRDQWIQRLVDYFLPDGALRPSWVSTDLRSPGVLTAATYQALHSLCSGEVEDEVAEGNEEQNGNHCATYADHAPNEDELEADAVQLPDFLANAGFRTLVVDEAHHLRAEWWKTLTFVAEHLDEPTIVALTATPPYDVSPFEWQRYEEMCGRVDAEVSVPELVLQGDLCPHQDYVYFTLPAEKDLRTLFEFRTAVDLFVQRLRSNVSFKSALLAHPWITSPDTNTEAILEDPEYLSSIAIYLHAVGEKVPATVLRTLGLPNKRIPALDLGWLETLLTHCLYSDSERYAGRESLFRPIRHELIQIGAIERRKVKLRNPSDHTKLLTSSVTKLKAIEDIVRLECGSLSDNLRCLILTDFIRKAEMASTDGEKCVFEDIGIVPIFETLRSANLAGARLGVLSGSLVIVPTAAESMLRKGALELGIHATDLSVSPLAHDPAYSTVELRGEYYQGPLRLITSLFERGGVTVLVGTKSLLGEGWDEPVINTLILASFVGSYVLSNQMRGRSIRVDTRQPQKTANIWHLVCVEPGPFGPGDDYDLLTRRCNAFVGVSATSPIIESGIGRLGLGQPPFSCEQISRINSSTCSRALDRLSLQQRWKEALASGIIKQMTDGLRAGPQALPRGFVLRNTIASLFVQAGWVFTFVFSELMRARIRVEHARDLLALTAVFAAIASVVSLPWTLSAVWRFIRHGTPEMSIRQIGCAVLEALQYEGSIRRHLGEFQVCANRNDDGTVFCWIGGGSGKEQSVYLQALREVLRPFENPRFILARRRILGLFREDYFAVPDALGRKKEFAEFFAKRWQRLVGPAELVYTRTPDGRRALLRARLHSLAAAFQKRAERVSCWK